jgi:hypothetical protein
LPQRGQIQPEAFADAALGVFYLVVDLVSGNVDKPCGEIGEERLKLQLVAVGRNRTARVFTLRV